MAIPNQVRKVACQTPPKRKLRIKKVPRKLKRQRKRNQTMNRQKPMKWIVKMQSCLRVTVNTLSRMKNLYRPVMGKNIGVLNTKALWVNSHDFKLNRKNARRLVINQPLPTIKLPLQNRQLLTVLTPRYSVISVRKIWPTAFQSWLTCVSMPALKRV